MLILKSMRMVMFCIGSLCKTNLNSTSLIFGHFGLALLAGSHFTRYHPSSRTQGNPNAPAPYSRGQTHNCTEDTCQ